MVVWMLLNIFKMGAKLAHEMFGCHDNLKCSTPEFLLDPQVLHCDMGTVCYRSERCESGIGKAL